MNKKTIVAFVYDFDHTLCTTDMQNYSFIPSVGLDSKTFWNMSDRLVKTEHMDGLLSYMYIMLQQCQKQGIPLTREKLNELGKDIQYFKGVDTWFERLNAYGKEKGVEVQHFIISSGNREIIEGSAIYKYFTEVFACEYLYKDGIAVWPKSVVNYTTKTQYIYRISKGILNLSENNKLNSSMPDEDKPIPISNMVYIADGLTDVPCMKTVRLGGGYAIAVYDDKKKPALRLLNDRRVDFVTPADYSEGSMIEDIAKSIIDKVAPMDRLNKLHWKQLDEEN